MTTTKQHAEGAFQRLFNAFPSYRDFLGRQPNPNATLDAWAAMVASCDSGDIDWAVAQFVGGEVEPYGQYEKPDVLPKRLKDMANARRSERKERLRMNKYHLTANQAKTTDQKFVVAMRESTRCGYLRRDGEITEDENNARVRQLVAWSEYGGPEPDYFKEMSE